MDAHRSRVLFLSTPAETSESQGSQCAGACALPADDLRASTHGIRPSHHKQSSASPPKPQQTWQWEPKNQSTALTSSCARVPGLRRALPDLGTESASRDGEGQCQVVLPWGPELSYLCPSGCCPPSCHCASRGQEAFTSEGNIQGKQDASALGNATATRDMSCDICSCASSPP